ncbi:MAG: hypothetical protein H8D26_02495 [Methanomicrobia archaeon]|nr:hypothetical protein [Methanomicrobia archaeon]
MDTYSVGRLPVVKRGGGGGGGEEERVEELIGIISRADIIREHCHRWDLLRGSSSS